LRRAVTGLRAWLVQRVTAVYMLLFIVFLLVHFLHQVHNEAVVLKQFLEKNLRDMVFPQFF
jgi:succinate dehydrogenase hydrophobic anchor subunit